MSKTLRCAISAIFTSRVAFFTLIYLAANAFTGVFCQEERLTLTLPQGEIQGVFETYKRNNGDEVKHSVFRGIPYAKAPVGPLRLKVSRVSLSLFLQ